MAHPFARGDALAEPYAMFDFAPVGLAVAVVGVIYVALIGWRLIPIERGKTDSGTELFELEWHNGDRLFVHMRNEDAEGRIFDATLDMRRVELSRRLQSQIGDL